MSSYRAIWQLDNIGGQQGTLACFLFHYRPNILQIFELRPFLDMFPNVSIYWCRGIIRDIIKFNYGQVSFIYLLIGMMIAFLSAFPTIFQQNIITHMTKKIVSFIIWYCIDSICFQIPFFFVISISMHTSYFFSVTINSSVLSCSTNLFI